MPQHLDARPTMQADLDALKAQVESGVTALTPGEATAL